MPELPEVETVVRQLAAVIPGEVIEQVEVFDPKLAHLNQHPLAGRRIRRVLRVGKQIAVVLAPPRGGQDSARVLVFHLRMTGALIWRSEAGRTALPRSLIQSPSASRPPRAVLRCRSGALEFFDVRRFGTIRLEQSLRAARPKGLDPLSLQCSAASLELLLANCRQPVKHWLMRQDKLVGIGNIYASEILFRARLDPRAEASRLTRAEVSRLYRATRAILLEAIAHSGTTFSDFKDTSGGKGTFQSRLKVYGRAGTPCRRCGTAIEKIVQQGRSTCFCPKCQRSTA